MCINSAKFQKDWIKRVQNNAIFAFDMLWIHRISAVFASLLAQFSPSTFVFCLPCCTGFWDTYFVEETRKMTYFERASRPWMRQKESPSNQHKQWNCDLFVSGNIAHFSLRISIARVRETDRVNTQGTRRGFDRLPFFCRLPHEFGRINRLWKIGKISCDNIDTFMFIVVNFNAGKQVGFIISWYRSRRDVVCCCVRTKTLWKTLGSCWNWWMKRLIRRLEKHVSSKIGIRWYGQFILNRCGLICILAIEKVSFYRGDTIQTILPRIGRAVFIETKTKTWPLSVLVKTLIKVVFVFADVVMQVVLTYIWTASLHLFIATHLSLCYNFQYQ